jgi:predicted nuclease of predicted toxin-antitoxin system
MFGVVARAVRDLRLREAKARAIFHAAREAGAVVMSKDSDFDFGSILRADKVCRVDGDNRWRI